MTLEWDRDFYKTGYEGFEVEKNFPTPKTLEDYRRRLLEKSGPQVEFIARQVGRRPLRVLEFGSGNGRLLISLAQCGLLAAGLGVEISQSRTVFAQRWTRDLGLANLQHVNADALTFTGFSEGGFDLAVCITGAFGYFKPIRDSAPGELLAAMRRALAPGGYALLELYQLPEKRQQMLALNDNRLRLWQPLPPEDRFAYCLNDFEYDAGHKLLKHGKIFIGRDSTVDAGRIEVLAYYTSEEVTGLLAQHGLALRLLCADFDAAAYQEGVSNAMILLAQSE